MLGIPEETFEEIADEIPTFDEKFYGKLIYEITYIMADKLNEMSFESVTTYNNIYWFVKGYNATKSKKNDDEHFKNFNHYEFKVNLSKHSR